MNVNEYRRLTERLAAVGQVDDRLQAVSVYGSQPPNLDTSGTIRT